MYKLQKESATIALLDSPTYIRKHGNGAYVLCPEPEATGVAHNGTPYHLIGRAEMEGLETVMLAETDSGTEIQQVADVSGIVFVSLAEAGNVDPVTASEHVDLFAPWVSSVNYTVGKIRSFGGKLYKCLQAHLSQVNWPPDEAVSLWTPISDPAEEWPAWSQPIGSHDAYQKGSKCAHQGKHWTSDTDGNVWEPGAYGWTEAVQ